MMIKSDFQNREYWNSIAEKYNRAVDIALEDFHYGPLVPGDSKLRLLPGDLKGKRCLEVGCGAAQNSIYLAGQGALCTALDISDEQLRFGALIAEKNGVSVELIRESMDKLADLNLGRFDLIFSSYAISFTPDPDSSIQQMADMLTPGGTLLISTGHPVFSGEWVELGDGDDGLFLKNYFKPVPDSRFDDDGNEIVRSDFYPIGTMANWIIKAGLSLVRIEEPEALPVENIPQEAIPYRSKGWLGYYNELKNIPAVVIYKAVKDV